MSLPNVSTIIQLTRNPDREEMFSEILKHDGEYQETGKKINDIFKKLINLSSDDEFKKLLLDMEAAGALLESLACDTVYEKGVNDGIQLILKAMINLGTAELPPSTMKWR